MNKIKLYRKIKHFYNAFGEVVGPSFITSIGDMTNDNLHDVQFDINEVVDCCDDETAHDLNKLYDQISTYRETPKTELHWDTIICTIGIILAIAFAVYQVATAENPWAKEESEVVQEQVIHTRYTAFGRYHTNGTVVSDNGNEWTYTTDTISDKTPYDNMPVWIGFDDNGTPTDVTDDIVLGLVFDVYTAIYDDLEVSLSDSFELERNGNNIHVKEMR